MQINKYNLYEQSFVSAINYSNPFTIPFSASLTSPTGNIFRVNGFYDGGTIWKLGFVPDELGAWMGTTTSTDQNLNNKNFQFDCISPELGSYGFLQKDLLNPYYIKFENGNYFLPIGDTNTAFVMDQSTKMTPYGWKEYFDEMQSDIKTNHLYDMMITNPSWNYYGYYAWPFGGTASFPDFNRYNLEQYGFYDEVLDYAESKGVVVSLLLLDWITEPKDYPSNILTTAQKQSFYKYTIARIGHHKNIIWNLYWDIAPDQQFVRDEGNYIKSIDPYTHLLTSHQRRDTGYSYAVENWTDIISLETLDELNGDDIKNWRMYNKPVIIAEDRYSWYRWPDNPPYFYRRLLWTSILSGGYATWGEHDCSYATNAEFEANADPTCHRFGGKKEFKYIYKLFLNYSIPFWEMAPHDELVSPGNKCLAKLGDIYIIYIPNPNSGEPYTYDYGCGGPDHNSVNSNKVIISIAVNLISFGSTTVYAMWYNPRTGKFIKTDTVNGGSTLTLTAPDIEDWVIIITKCQYSSCDFTITATS